MSHISPDKVIPWYVPFRFVPKSEISFVEALRHLYLRKPITNINFPKTKKSLIVLGDYENTNTKCQLSILNKLPKTLTPVDFLSTLLYFSTLLLLPN